MGTMIRGVLPALLLLAACSPSEATEASNEESAESTTSVATGPDPGIAGCQAACGVNAPFDEGDVVEQPGAEVGDLTRCPVSDAVFRVRRDQPTVEHGGITCHVCCDGCAERFREEPARFAVRRAS